MIDDAIVLQVERLRDEAESLKAELRNLYPSASQRVKSPKLRFTAASIAERWLVNVAARADVYEALGGSALAERNVNFQRLLTSAERATLRRTFDKVLSALLKDFRSSVVIPLKARRVDSSESARPAPSRRIGLNEARIVFVGKSFADSDAKLNGAIERLLKALGLEVVTGEKPRAEMVSRKVRERIDQCDVFVGVFVRKDKIEGKDEWSTSPWVVDEKAYALARNRKLVLIREAGVSSIGGLQGDYEYLEFDRNKLEELMIRLVEIFRSNE